MLSANVEAGVVAQAVSPAYSEFERTRPICRTFTAAVQAFVGQCQGGTALEGAAGDTL